MSNKKTPEISNLQTENLQSNELKNVIVHFFNINWNTEQFGNEEYEDEEETVEEPELPSNVFVHVDEFRDDDFELTIGESISQFGADFLSDTFDFLIYDFDFEIIKDEENRNWRNDRGNLIIHYNFESTLIS
jgi:hypothetical protein